MSADRPIVLDDDKEQPIKSDVAAQFSPLRRLLMAPPVAADAPIEPTLTPSLYKTSAQKRRVEDEKQGEDEAPKVPRVKIPLKTEAPRAQAIQGSPGSPSTKSKFLVEDLLNKPSELTNALPKEKRQAAPSPRMTPAQLQNIFPSTNPNFSILKAVISNFCSPYDHEGQGWSPRMGITKAEFYELLAMMKNKCDRIVHSVQYNANIDKFQLEERNKELEMELALVKAELAKKNRMPEGGQEE